MKSLTLLLIITLGAYGYAGLDTDRIRAALPLREGDKLSSGSRDKTIETIRQAVKQASGREPSIDEKDLTKMINRGEVEPIINALSSQKK